MVFSKLIIPTAFLYGNKAKIAIKQKIALSISDSNIAYTYAYVIYRNKSTSFFLSAYDINNSDDNEIILQVKNISKKLSNFCNLDMRKSYIMGILNITPDSFSDGSLYYNLNKLDKQIDKFIAKGLKIIDIGGESTRPNSLYINSENEINRIKPILKVLKNKNIYVSIDTRKANVMEYAINNGGNIINDISSLKFRANLKMYGEDTGDSKKIILKYNCPVILMHSKGLPNTMQNNPYYDNVLFEIYDFFEYHIKKLTTLGFSIGNIVIDPGIGFGKTVEHNLIILKNISIFHSLNVGILVGVSRKSFIGKIISEKNILNRLGGSLSVVNFVKNSGVQLHRVHDIMDSINQDIINTVIQS